MEINKSPFNMKKIKIKVQQCSDRANGYTDDASINYWTSRMRVGAAKSVMKLAKKYAVPAPK